MQPSMSSAHVLANVSRPGRGVVGHLGVLREDHLAGLRNQAELGDVHLDDRTSSSLRRKENCPRAD